MPIFGVQVFVRMPVLNPEYLYKDDFTGFFNDRKEQILQRIERAMNKKIPREEVQGEEGVFIGEEQDEE